MIPKYPVTDHCNGFVFFNPWPAKEHSFKEFLKVVPEIRRAAWPTWVDIPQQPPLPAHYPMDGETRCTVINHATALIQIDGLNILTDPVYSERVSPFSGLGPKRVHRPGVAFEDLPSIDLVLISHNHYDHLDLKTLRQLDQKFSPTIVTGLGNKSLLNKKGFPKVIENDWWQTQNFDRVQVHFVPAQHFSSRGLNDRNKTLWGGFVIESSRQKIYFAGDTGYGPLFKEIWKRFGPMDVSLLPIGAYEPRWFMKPVHMNPEDAVLAHLDLQSKKSIGIHFGCFKLTAEAIQDPELYLRQALEKRGLSFEEFLVPEFGKGYSFVELPGKPKEKSF